MLVIDAVIGNVIGFIRDQILRRQQIDRDAVSHARIAMRKLAASLAETQAYFEAFLHRLERARDDPLREGGFFSTSRQFATAVLRRTCLAGLCRRA